MEVTKTTQTARLLAGADAMVFNDKLKDGTRSLKVWGWTEADYAKAKIVLEIAGCKVKVVQFTRYRQRGARTVTQTRLHVTE